MRTRKRQDDENWIDVEIQIVRKDICRTISNLQQGSFGVQLYTRE